ncbi:flagellar type III secretion system pore protein FliP [Exilibacterium tricleocarpae]|uniref:Flagellar biosynthetic protein FliP n=1 Tax=Exilibacterium tricleocarpae TaxID=2591008 RepID=A0A545T892_9GAMM|nr:flagellar type III secretion system pore protein FliP [Exilibacterium tricleocarpae]
MVLRDRPLIRPCRLCASIPAGEGPEGPYPDRDLSATEVIVFSGRSTSSAGARPYSVLVGWVPLLLGLSLLGLANVAAAQDVSLPGITLDFGAQGGDPEETATALKVLLGLTVLSLAPAILIAMTSFTRIVIVLSMLRHAFGMQQTPPNTVIVSMALFLTVFNMLPTFKQIEAEAFQPYMDGALESRQALDEGLTYLHDFMIRQTREEDLMLMVDVAKAERPASAADIETFLLVPAFMLSELKSAFQIGFVIFLPFLLIDLVVASVLMSMGMLMVPPMMISLPIKVLMFVLIDGWNLVVYSLLNSFS